MRDAERIERAMVVILGVVSEEVEGATALSAEIGGQLSHSSKFISNTFNIEYITLRI